VFISACDARRILLASCPTVICPATTRSVLNCKSNPTFPAKGGPLSAPPAPKLLPVITLLGSLSIVILVPSSVRVIPVPSLSDLIWRSLSTLGATKEVPLPKLVNVVIEPRIVFTNACSVVSYTRS